MKKLFTLILLLVLTFNCSENSNLENTDKKISNLKRTNDSLQSIIDEINTKWVFDSIAIRKIYHHENSYQPNSVLRAEFVIAGFSENETYFIEYDSIINDEKINPKRIERNINGGFNFATILKKDNYFYHDVVLNSKYGKKDTLEITNVIN